MSEHYENGNGRMPFISWQQLVTVVLPIIVAIVTGGVIVANVMLSRMEDRIKDQQTEVREMTQNLNMIQQQLAVIRAQQRKFYEDGTNKGTQGSW